MQISGLDLCCEGLVWDWTDLETTRDVVLKYWPKAVIAMDHIVPMRLAELTPDQLRVSIFFYESFAAKHRWDSFGAVPKTKDSMFWMWSAPDGLCFVVEDEPCMVTATIAVEIQKALLYKRALRADQEATKA